LNKNIRRGKLAPYFIDLQKTVGKLIMQNPNVVFLSPAGNETYFEHVYLSSYLGFKLVEEQ
jgi:uncharacterized circularly permuted ATP-grasp superfamily protein